MGKCGSTAPPANVEEYLSSVPEPARSTLRKIRGAIRAALPAEATESISYGMPMFKCRKMVAGYAAFAKHCSFFPGSHPIEVCRKELEGYPISKGTIRFPVDKPLPAALVKKLVKVRLAEIEVKKRLKAGGLPS
jgi:uncharacterized protein YdhG (YjbR/CyaY superfamily)